MATEQQDLLFVEALGDPPELETFSAFRKYVNLACADQYQLLQGAECTYDPDPVVRAANEAKEKKRVEEVEKKWYTTSKDKLKLSYEQDKRKLMRFLVGTLRKLGMDSLVPDDVEDFAAEILSSGR